MSNDLIGGHWRSLEVNVKWLYIGVLFLRKLSSLNKWKFSSLKQGRILQGEAGSGIWGLPVPSAHFFYKSTTVLKIKFTKFKKIGGEKVFQPWSVVMKLSLLKLYMCCLVNLLQLMNFFDTLLLTQVHGLYWTSLFVLYNLWVLTKA